VHLTFAASRGFRAANAADFGTIGLTGGGGFEIAPVTAAELGGLVGSSAATGAVSTGRPVPALGPEVTYAYEPGVKFRSERLSAWLVGFHIDYVNTIQRRAIVFPAGLAGSTISGFTVERQDTTGLGYIAQDQRPIGTRVNVDRARMRGFEAEATYRLSRRLRARAFYSLSDGRLSTGEYMRRMPPPLGGVSLRWGSSDDTRWVEGVISFAGEQNRLNAGDLTDARIGGSRTRAAVAGYFSGTATDLRLVSNGVLIATGETLGEVQNRVLGTAASAPLFDRHPGFAIVGVRGGWHLTPAVALTLVGDNLTDRNYRLYGSGVDAAGANVQLRLRYRF
jgi:outer membrane receptor protein involved in Fe transport